MKQNSREWLRAIISSVLSFLLSIGFVILTTIVAIQWIFFSKTSIYNYLETKDYYNILYSQIYNNSEALTLPTGLSIDVLKGVFEPEVIEKDINGYIDAEFSDKIYVVDTTLIEQKLDENIYKFLINEQMTPNQEQEQNIKAYIDTITESYANSVKLPMLGFYAKARELYNKVFIIGIAASAIYIAAIILSLTKLNHPKIRVLQYITYSVLAAIIILGTGYQTILKQF